MTMLLQVCVNGARALSAHPVLSSDAQSAAAEAASAVAAGAAEIHVHPKDAAGRDSLAADDVARWIEEMRAACPEAPIGVTTGAWASPDPVERVNAIGAWRVLPDFASVNWHEDGADDVAAQLLRLGVGFEAGIWDAVGLEAWSRSPSRRLCRRVLVELPDESEENVRPHAERLIAHVRLTEPRMPILLHGEEQSTWAAFALAVELGVDSRIGLEDCLRMPDGSIAAGNAALVRAAVEMMA